LIKSIKFISNEVTQAEQILQVVKIKNETSLVLSNIMNKTQSNIKAVTEIYKAQINTVTHLSKVAIAVCCLLILSVMAFDIPRILNSELFKAFVNLFWKRIVNWLEKQRNKRILEKELENEIKEENNYCVTESFKEPENEKSSTNSDKPNLSNIFMNNTSEGIYESKHNSKLTKWDINQNDFKSVKAASRRLEYLVDKALPSLGPQQREIFLKEKLIKTFSAEMQSKLKKIENKSWNEFVQDIDSMEKKSFDLKVYY
jgi:hypothetical protein